MNTEDSPRTSNKPLGLLERPCEQVFFYIAFTIWMFGTILYQTSFFAVELYGAPYKLLRILAYGFAALSQLSALRHNYRSIGALIVIFIVAFFLGPQFSGQITDGLVLLYCARNQEFRTIAKWSMAIIGTAVVVIIASAHLGIIQNYTEVGRLRTREYLGFRYALYPSQFILSYTCLHLYVRYVKLTVWDFVFLIAVNFYLFKATDSRYSFYLAIGTIALVVLLKVTHEAILHPKWVGYLGALTPFFFGAASALLTVLYDPSITFLRAINSASVLGGRLSLGQAALNEYGITPFGQYIVFVGSGIELDGQRTAGVYNYVDSLYLRSLVQYGVFFTIIFFGLLTYAIWQAWKHAEGVLFISLVVVAAHCAFDDLSLQPYFNPLLFAVALAFFRFDKNLISLKSVKAKRSAYA